MHYNPFSPRANPKTGLKALLSSLFVSLLVSSMSSAQAQPALGDYDLDGKTDLAVAIVNKAAGTSGFLVRPSSGAPLLNFNFNVPADAFVTGRWFPDGKVYPGAVYVRDAKTPLEWYVKTPSGADAPFLFGLPGDLVPNTAFDLDGDGITDPVVVRTVAGNLLWYVALSGSGGAIYETAFGLAGDKPTVGQDPDGVGKLYVLRTGNIWFGRRLFGGEISQVQWGLAGDQPLAPQLFGGLVTYSVTRKTATGLVAYTLRSDGQTLALQLGTNTVTPVIGNFFGLGTDFAYYDRSIGLVGVRLPDGNALSVKFGIPENAVVGGDGTVWPATVAGGETSSTPTASGDCQNIVSISKLSGVLYKPINEHGGRGPTLIVKNGGEKTNTARLEIRDALCRPIGALGRFTNDGAYGARYYSKTRPGTGYTHTQLRALAQKAGSTAILIEGRGKWIRIENPENRQGKL